MNAASPVGVPLFARVISPTDILSWVGMTLSPSAAFKTNQPLMELIDARFPTKDCIMAQEAIHELVRLYQP